MAKIKIKTLLINSNESISNEYLGIYANDSIIYKDNNVNVTLLLKDNNINLKRCNEEYELYLNFSSKDGYYKLNNYNSKTIFKIEIKDLYLDNNKIMIEYTLFSGNEKVDSFKFNLEYEVIS